MPQSLIADQQITLLLETLELIENKVSKGAKIRKMKQSSTTPNLGYKAYTLPGKHAKNTSNQLSFLK